MAMGAIAQLSDADTVQNGARALISILDGQVMQLIQAQRGDQYKFLNYIPFTSQTVQNYALRAMGALLDRFGFVMQPKSQFCVLDDIF